MSRHGTRSGIALICSHNTQYGEWKWCNSHFQKWPFQQLSCHFLQSFKNNVPCCKSHKSKDQNVGKQNTKYFLFLEKCFPRKAKYSLINSVLGQPLMLIFSQWMCLFIKAKRVEVQTQYKTQHRLYAHNRIQMCLGNVGGAINIFMKHLYEIFSSHWNKNMKNMLFHKS